MSPSFGTGWSEPAPGALVRQSSAYRMNSLAVVAEGGVLLVDPGVFPQELEDIDRAVRPLGEIQLFFSHSHWDHVLGRLRWREAPLIAHRRFSEELDGQLDEMRTNLAQLDEEFYLDWGGEVSAWSPSERVGEHHAWSWRGRELRAHHAPGHAPDQLMLHLPRERLLFAADMLSDLEIPLLGGPCHEYLDSLHRVEQLVRQDEVRILVPGHGAAAHGRAEIEARLERDLHYLEELDRRVLEARARRQGLTETLARCRELGYAGGRIPDRMESAHEKNVRRAYHGLSDE